MSPVRTVRLILPNDASPAVKVIADILARQIWERCGAKVSSGESGPLTVTLDQRRTLPAEGYRIEDGAEGSLRISGADERGLLYGVGKWLRTSRYDHDAFTPGTWRGASAPKCPVRMLYLATHFNNFFEAAPIDEVIRYIQDVSLWGYNTIAIHYPTWQFRSQADPAARKWLARFKTVLAEIKKCGLMAGLLQAPGQTYRPSPPELRKTNVPGSCRGNWGEGLCVSKPEAMQLLTRLYGDLLDEFKQVGLDYFVCWPYDEGGCACKDCWPWGPRGFIRSSKVLAQQVRERFPQCKLVLSTWCFEAENDANPDGEWVGLSAELAADRSWVDYLMADGHEDYFPAYILNSGVPGDLPLLNFPEISMFHMSPWGGYGTNPAPAHFEKLWTRIKRQAAGGAPYAEGIYEDLNKAIVAGFYWDPERTAEETVKEYVSFEYSPDVAEDLAEVVRIFEQNHKRADIQASARRALEVVRRADKVIPRQARAAWRWRIFYLRALIDNEIFERQVTFKGVADHKFIALAGGRELSGSECATLKEAFAELTRLYYAQDAHTMPIKPIQFA